MEMTKYEKDMVELIVEGMACGVSPADRIKIGNIIRKAASISYLAGADSARVLAKGGK